MLLLLLLATGTAIATGVGAIPVFALGSRAERLGPVLWAVAAGVMVIASAGLVRSALQEGSIAVTAAGLAGGAALLLLSRRALAGRDVHLAGATAAGSRRALLVFGVLFVHSLPEGMAIGAAWGSGSTGLGVFVVIAMALQNVPEGTAIAIPLNEAGVSRWRQFWAAVLTSAPQPAGAAGAYLLVESSRRALPAALALAAGAMLTLVLVELVPAIAQGRRVARRA